MFAKYPLMASLSASFQWKAIYKYYALFYIWTSEDGFCGIIKKYIFMLKNTQLFYYHCYHPLSHDSLFISWATWVRFWTSSSRWRFLLKGFFFIIRRPCHSLYKKFMFWYPILSVMGKLTEISQRTNSVGISSVTHLLCTLHSRRPGIAEGDERTRLGRVHLYFFCFLQNIVF